MRPEEARRAAIQVELGDFLLHRSSDAMRHLVRLIDALVEDTLADLAAVSKDSLERKQGSLAQLIALRRAIVDPGPHASPKP